MPYPVIAGIGLNSKEEKIVDFWLSRAGDHRKLERVIPLELLSGLNYFPEINSNLLKEITDWHFPLLIAAGSKLSPDNIRELFEKGICAIWSPEEDNGINFFPKIELPHKERQIFVVTDDGIFTRTVRQLLAFAGLDIRTDFRNDEEIIQILRALYQNAEKKPPHPDLLLLDLESKKVDMPLFFHRLRQLHHEYPEMKNQIPTLIIKDFQKPGIDVVTLARSIRPFSRRIFHYREALSILIEAYFFRQENYADEINTIQKNNYQSIREYIFGTTKPELAKSPSSTLSMLGNKYRTIQPALPFLKFYDYLHSDPMPEGAILASCAEN